MNDEEFRKEWIKALRSGEYKQGKNTMRSSDNTFCCIGVACDLRPEFRWVLTSDGKGYYLTNGAEYGSNSYTVGSLDEPEVIGLTLEAQDALIGLNDDQGFTFSEIADVLEAKVYDETGVVI